jgi:bifunctional DNA-binding transcriptional regulator/antitoxin component of YhaV-PrlF toxin-antitoxin module
MSTWTTSSISTEGRLTLPQELRDRLRLRQGTKVLMQEVADGVVLMTTRPLTRSQVAEYLLDSLVTGIGPEAEKLGFHDEEDLDGVIQAIRERTFAERYGTPEVA